MNFASGWLDGKALFPEFIEEAPDPDTGIIIVVPAYNEPGIAELLDSLAKCEKPDCSTEVLIIINTPATHGTDYELFNEITSSAVKEWKSKHEKCFFRLYDFIADSSRFPQWGVGMARKTGMDEAVRRFGRTGRAEGVIASLDADCAVEKNYLVQLCEELLKRKERVACSVYFEHPLSGAKFPVNFYRSVAQYELHMRYYVQALKFTGFPNAFHTVGSAFAVKALPYIKSGGMNRRQAGEDFYFIQKIMPFGGYFSLNTTVIYPSPRSSARVPFGTGATIGRMDEDNASSLRTFDFAPFEELRVLFGMLEKVFECKTDNSLLHSELPSGVRSFISEEEWKLNVTEIRENTSGYSSFRKRFFSWFNMLRIIRYLNYVHGSIYKKMPVNEAAVTLLTKIGIQTSTDDPEALLLVYRSLEKKYQ